jgi:hypothetical protein
MIIGLCGFAQSGKDSLAEALVRDEGFKRVAFADKMKDILSIINPYVRYVNDHGAVHFLRVQEAVKILGWEDTKQFTEVRSMLQKLGTEGGRELLGKDVWISAAFKDITLADKKVVFTDVRFPNEAEAIKKANGIIIRIVRGDTLPVNNHSSETAYTEQDYVIYNNGTKEDMYFEFKRIINEHK